MERMHVSFRCGLTKKRFTVTLVERPGEKSFLFESAMKGYPVPAPGSKGANSPSAELPASSVIWAGFACPYGCNPAGIDFNILRCVCGGLACVGGVKNTPSGAPYYYCPWCHEGGEIKGTIDKIEGSPVQPGRPSLGSGTRPQELDGPSRPQLR